MFSSGQLRAQGFGVQLGEGARMWCEASGECEACECGRGDMVRTEWNGEYIAWFS